MIDNYKIEKAANLHRFELIASMHNPYQCFEEVVDAETDLIEDSFITGAKFAINEFLKDLWHPAEEKPKKGCVFLYKTIFDGYGLNQIIDGNEWEYIIKYQKATQWLYIDDLISKEGDDNRRIRKA